MTLTRPSVFVASLFAVAFVLSLAASQAMAQQAAENINKPHVRPTAVIPLLAKAPTIDGVISEGEWNTLQVARFTSQQGDLLQRRPGEFWIGSDGKKLYVAVRSGVHPVAGVLAKVQKGAGKLDTGNTMDDSLELWFNNNPGGKTGQYYQISVNSLGAIYDQSFELTDKVGQMFWRVDMEQAHTIDGNTWTAEFAIDLASINVTDVTKPLAVRVCRNYKHRWDQSRWAPGVIPFDAPETMPQVRFAQAAPVVREAGVQDANGINVAVEVGNPTDAPLPVTVKLGYNAEAQPRYYKDFALDLKPGEKKLCEYRLAYFTSDDYPALGEILVTGADGTVYYHRDFKWRTQPKDDAWQPMGSLPPAEAVKLAIEFHPTPKILRWRAEFGGMKGREEIKTARVAVVDAAGAKIGEQAADRFKEFATEQQLRLDHLADGNYVVQLFLDAAGPAAEPVKTAPFQLISNFVWMNNKIGISDKVIPPFTPLEVKGNTVSAVLRDHDMSDTGLWKQVKSKGKDILAAPITIEVSQEEGKYVPATGTLAFITQKPNAVVAQSQWKAGPIDGKTTSEIDYDGCMKVTLEFSQATAAGASPEVKAMRLVIPLPDKMAPLVHTCGDGMRFNYAGVVPAGEGVVWSSDKASRSAILGTFLPYVYIGGEERGLCWFAESDKDWVLDFKEKTSALQIERRNGIVSLIVNVIQAPTTLKRAHKIVFGLQATPVKPMPANWRAWGCAAGGKFESIVLGMCSYWGGHMFGVFPRERDFTIVQKIAEAKKTGKPDKEYFEAYKKKYPEIKNEIQWSANPGKADAVIPYVNIRGAVTYTPEWIVFQNEWQTARFPSRRSQVGGVGGVDFSITPTPSRRDFLLYYYREFLENGFDGFFWDNIRIYSVDNPVSGRGYTRDDGSYQPSCDIWEIREVTKRTAVLCDEMGRINVNMPHMTNACLVPVFSWTGWALDWEWKYGYSDFQDRFTREYIRASSLGLTIGNVPVILPGIRNFPSKEVERWCERTRIAACVPHEIKVWQADPLLRKLTQDMFDVGYSSDDCKVYRYWDEDPVAKIEGTDGIFLVVEGKDKVMVVVSDYGEGAATVTVTLDTNRLGLPADYKAVNWEDPDHTATASGGAMDLKTFKKHDFRAMLIEKK